MAQRRSTCVRGGIRYRHPVEPAVERIPLRRIVLGPWPFAPLPIIVLGWLSYFNRVIIVSGLSADAPRSFVSLVVEGAVVGAVVVAVAVSPMVVYNRIHRGAVPSRGVYFGVIALVGVVASVAQVASRYVVSDSVTGQGLFESIPLTLVVNFVLLAFFAIALTNATGYFAYRIRRQTRMLEEQVHQLEDQRRLVVEADQRIRTDVARALHDDIQGALLRAVLRLNRMAASAPTENAEAMREVIADLEALRGEGVRSISRRLAPPIESIGISSALQDLAEAYRGSIEVSIAIDDAARTALGGWRDGQLAIYRLVEQALLNAAAHGHAETARVEIVGVPGAVVLRVEDDGAGLDGPIVPGMGLAVVDAWIGITGGTWGLEPAATRGAVLHATLPVATT